MTRTLLIALVLLTSPAWSEPASYVVFGSFLERSNAETHRASVESKLQVEAFISTVNLDERIYYRVHNRPSADRKFNESLVASARDAGLADAWISTGNSDDGLVVSVTEPDVPETVVFESPENKTVATMQTAVESPNADERTETGSVSEVMGKTPPLDDRPPRGSDREIEAFTVEEPPVIDGRLEEAAWSRASPAERFWISESSRWPDVQTEVRVLADERFLYFAFRCYDDGNEPFALKTVRDSGLGFDDQVQVQLDTFGDHKSVSTFSVNAIGTQNDDIAGGRANKIEWKGDWSAAAVKTDYGWSAEIAIPFGMLNYRPGQRDLNINFIRYHHRTRERSRWADVTPQFKLEEMGHLTGIRMPAQKKADPWSFMPYIIAGRNVIDRDGELQEQMLDGGLDIRYEPSRNATMLLSLRPDFTQVERQITNINFDYDEKGVSDPRTFFREGEDYFAQDRRFFYSPRIPDFDAGVKAFGQSGGVRYGAMFTSSPESRNDVVTRASYAFSRTHSADLMFVMSDRQRTDHQTIAFSSRGRQASGIEYGLDAAYTHNQEPAAAGTVRGALIDVSLGWAGDYWRTGIAYDRYDDDFLPLNGLYRGSRIGTDAQSVFINYYRDFGGDTVRDASAYAGYAHRKTADGRTQNENLFLSGGIELYEFVRTTVSYSDGDFRPQDGPPGQFGDVVNEDHYWSINVDLNTRSSKFGYGLFYASDDLGGGEYEYTTGYAWLRLTPAISLNASSEKLISFGEFRQSIVGATWDVTPENSLSMRYVDSDDAESLRFGYRRHTSNGADIFFLYDDEPAAPAETSLKIVWSF